MRLCDVFGTLSGLADWVDLAGFSVRAGASENDSACVGAASGMSAANSGVVSFTSGSDCHFLTIASYVLAEL